MLNHDLHVLIHIQSHQFPFKGCLPPASAGFLLGLLFDPEDGGDMFFQNVGLYQNYTVLKFTRP
jgi:hypothetical protein